MNYKLLFLTPLLCFLITRIYGQSDGYWDKERATKKEIKIAARDRIIIKTNDFPVGTTELVYRITLLDQNQQMSNSLVSLLKSIPDPTGISQGTAGAVFLVSKISGEDKFQYAIFSKDNYAVNYKKTGKALNACFEQKNPVSQDGNRLSLDKPLCVLPSSQVLWFGFQSKNLIMNQKIVLEVVPWVNTKLSSGWSIENRKSVLNQCKLTKFSNSFVPTDLFCVCILEQIQKRHTHKEFQKLLSIEKEKLYNDLGSICLNQPNVQQKLHSDLRLQATNFIRQEKYKEAIEALKTLVDSGKANADDFNALGYSYLLSKQYSKAIKFLNEGEKLDDSNLNLQLNLAHCYLINDDFKTAKTIYLKYQNQNVNDSMNWVEKIKLDFDVFKKLNLPSKNFEKVIGLFDE